MSGRIVIIMLALLISYILIVYPIAIRGLMSGSRELLAFSAIASSLYAMVVVLVCFLKRLKLIE